MLRTQFISSNKTHNCKLFIAIWLMAAFLFHICSFTCYLYFRVFTYQICPLFTFLKVYSLLAFNPLVKVLLKCNTYFTITWIQFLIHSYFLNFKLSLKRNKCRTWKKIPSFHLKHKIWKNPKYYVAIDHMTMLWIALKRNWLFDCKSLSLFCGGGIFFSFSLWILFLFVGYLFFPFPQWSFAD